MTSGTRAHFDRQLAHLSEMVMELGARSRQAVADSMRALINGDADLAHEVIAGDVDINRLRYDVEMECYTLLVTEQPVASDMRAIVAALTIASDIERIADHGKKIAATSLRMAADPVPLPLGEIPSLAEQALAMLDRALRSSLARDVNAAEAVCRDDDTVDHQYHRIFDVVLAQMMEDPQRVAAGTHQIQIAHEIERCADRATNIAERVIYTVTGRLIELNM